MTDEGGAPGAPLIGQAGFGVSHGGNQRRVIPRQIGIEGCQRRLPFPLVGLHRIREVAQWVVANTPFDRLYYYGDDQPLQVSHGPEHNRRVVLLLAGKSGRLVAK
jgi:hypothetical protein